MSMATITHLHAYKAQSPEVTKSLCLQSSNVPYSNCFSCCNNYNYEEIMAEKANAPMPWIGLYVAGASLICTIAMAADLFLGFRNKKLWFPCKFFTLNAASLTLLAVAMKFPVDLSTSMPDKSDQMAKISSSVFICTLKRKLIPNPSSSSLRSATTMIDLTRYVLRLEGENELPERMLKNICDSVDRLIQMGKTQQPKNLEELLEKSTSFKGVIEFDNDQVPSLVSFEPPNSWMMPVVTLTSIATALPNISNWMVDGLLSSASEGLICISLIEKELDGKGDFVNIRNAAEVTWLGVELSRTWLDQDLRKMAYQENNSKGTLESFAEIAKNSIVELKEKENEVQKKNPLQWPVKAIAANSMYRISKTLLLDYDLGNELSDEELFKKLSSMISDILAACLTNLPRVITMKCFSSVTEKREERVQQAAHILGETEGILKILQQRELPSLNHDQSACIDEWRVIIKQENNLAFASSSSNDDTFSSGSGEIHIAVEHEAY